MQFISTAIAKINACKVNIQFWIETKRDRSLNCVTCVFDRLVFCVFSHFTSTVKFAAKPLWIATWLPLTVLYRNLSSSYLVPSPIPLRRTA